MPVTRIYAVLIFILYKRDRRGSAAAGLGKSKLDHTSSDMSHPIFNSPDSRTKRKSTRPLTTSQERIFIGVAFVLAFVVQLAVAFDLSALIGQ